MDLADQSRSEPTTKVVIPSDLAAAKQSEEIILDHVRRCGYSQDATFAIKLAMEEALTNAIKHGNRSDPTKRITICYAVSSQKTVINVADEGGGFRLDDVPDPTRDENLDCPTGRGIMLMRAYMNHVHYNRKGNEVTMVKLNEARPGAQA
jgi:serine/threonine-protein kinase RsbW